MSFLTKPLPDLSEFPAEVRQQIVELDREYREATVNYYQWILHAESLLHQLMAVLQGHQMKSRVMQSGQLIIDDPWEGEPN